MAAGVTRKLCFVLKIAALPLLSKKLFYFYLGVLFFIFLTNFSILRAHVASKSSICWRHRSFSCKGSCSSKDVLYPTFLIQPSLQQFGTYWLTKYKPASTYPSFSVVNVFVEVLVDNWFIAKERRQFFFAESLLVKLRCYWFHVQCYFCLLSKHRSFFRKLTKKFRYMLSRNCIGCWKRLGIWCINVIININVSVTQFVQKWIQMWMLWFALSYLFLMWKKWKRQCYLLGTRRLACAVNVSIRQS